MEFLKEHVSPETAYVIDDYPYGFRLRCKIRYWIEYKPKFGFRLVSQTSNPKKPGLVWNKPNAGTYSPFGMAMFLDPETGHVHHAGLHYTDATEAVAWRDKYGEGVPEPHRKILDAWIKFKLNHEAKANANAELTRHLVNGFGS